ncbi:hypothetical protein CSKR_203539 [Clonorchis sinensis]|uniref:Uncharacterized protein n=1 Tax=Clonorchis sinensis TaxID=79923 RepID=A0A8T1MB83_CLOSI|nr:hypothetical protein CSKR_203539 [Clonorchis sinensis]
MVGLVCYLSTFRLPPSLVRSVPAPPDDSNLQETLGRPVLAPQLNPCVPHTDRAKPACFFPSTPIVKATRIPILHCIVKKFIIKKETLGFIDSVDDVKLATTCRST